MQISGSLIEDMPKKEASFEDIVFFEKSLTNWCHLKYDWYQAQKGVMKLSTLKWRNLRSYWWGSRIVKAHFNCQFG
jgi:hypothetical protein